MKRIRNIFPFMISKFVLLCAFRHLKKKCKKKHARRIQRFEAHLEKNIERLHKALMNGTWKMHPYKHIVREECGKLREIFYSSDFGDLVVQCAIGITLGAVLNHTLIDDTYAGIPGRSLHKGMRRMYRKVQKYVGKPIYVYKMDFKKFYLSIDHDKLKEIIVHKIKDKRTVQLLFNLIDGSPTPVGIPIGNFISPILANQFLNGIDREARDRGYEYYRYNDDIIAFCESKEKMRKFQKMMHKLADALKLVIKPSEQIFPIERFGMDMMGFIVQRKRVLVRRTIERRVRRDARKLKAKYTPHRARGIVSRWGWFKRVKSGVNFWIKNVGCTIKQFKNLEKTACLAT